jgi:hypothetical protein
MSIKLVLFSSSAYRRFLGVAGVVVATLLPLLLPRGICA